MRRFTLERQVKYKNLKEQPTKHKEKSRPKTFKFYFGAFPLNRSVWRVMLSFFPLFYVQNFHEKAVVCQNPTFWMRTLLFFQDRFLKQKFLCVLMCKKASFKQIVCLVFFDCSDYSVLGIELGKGNHHLVYFDSPVQLLNSSCFICCPEALCSLLSLCNVSCMRSTVLSASLYSVSRTDQCNNICFCEQIKGCFIRLEMQ